jgi:hypothetical protein
MPSLPAENEAIRFDLLEIVARPFQGRPSKPEDCSTKKRTNLKRKEKVMRPKIFGRFN